MNVGVIYLDLLFCLIVIFCYDFTFIISIIFRIRSSFLLVVFSFFCYFLFPSVFCTVGIFLKFYCIDYLELYLFIVLFSVL